MTKKQLQEIEFLEKIFLKNKTSQKEREEYISHTVNGLKENNKNKLFEAKRRLDMNIKMWREDLTKGFLSADELKEDFNCEYGNKIVDSIIKGVDKDYRQKILQKKEATMLAFTNFPIIILLKFN